MPNPFNTAVRILSRWSDFTPIPKREKIAKDMAEDFAPVHEHCREYTMTSLGRMYALFEAVRYIVNAGIPGDFVECGVWQGGSAMIMAETLRRLGDTTRKIYLYDTFAGMPFPEERDTKIRGNTSGQDMWKKKQKDGGWLAAPLDMVADNLKKTRYPENNLVFVKGKVEDTIPKTIPEEIALLRLDTDWYSSTYHELTHLYPRLARKGVLIIDDYGSWKGSRDATDQYLSEHNEHILLNKIDVGRIGVKC